MYLDDLDKYLDKVKSWLKNLDFKNLDRDKKKVDLDMKDNLDGFQKLVSTWWTFSISISIGLDRRDPQPYFSTYPYSSNSVKAAQYDQFAPKYIW